MRVAFHVNHCRLTSKAGSQGQSIDERLQGQVHILFGCQIGHHLNLNKHNLYVIKEARFDYYFEHTAYAFEQSRQAINCSWLSSPRRGTNMKSIFYLSSAIVQCNVYVTTLFIFYKE